MYVHRPALILLLINVFTAKKICQQLKLRVLDHVYPKLDPKKDSEDSIYKLNIETFWKEP